MEDISQPANPITQQQPAVQPPMTNGNKPILPKILLAIIIISALTGIFILTRANISEQKMAKEPTQAPTMPVQTQQTTNGPQTARKTYQNKENKFSLQYPSNLQLKESPYGMGVASIELRSANNLDTNYLADFQMLIFPKFIAKTVGQDFDEYYNLSNNTSKTISAQGQSLVLTKLRNRSIANKRAFDYQTTDSPPKENEEPIIGVYIELGNNILIFSTPASNKDKLESILASFTYEG